MKDKFNREIEYLRISLTESCNLRCIYCMPEDNICFRGSEGLSKKEIEYLIDIFVEIGLKKIRFTGGEPLLRADLVELISFAKSKGIPKIAITTNGILLNKYLDPLVSAGLTEVNISLDSLKEDKFSRITRGGHLEDVLFSIKRAIEKGMKVKVNSVIIEDINEEDLIDLCRLSINYELDVRFIELMPIGEGVRYRGISGQDLINRIKEEFVLEESQRDGINGPASYYKILNGKGRVGFISALTNHFCDSCNRIRITSDGILKQCLHFKGGLDLKEVLRSGLGREDISRRIRETIFNKPKGHRFVEDGKGEDQRLMFQVGG